jgi:hypothetical protein
MEQKQLWITGEGATELNFQMSNTNNKKNETPLFATVFVVLSTLQYYMFLPT